MSTKDFAETLVEAHWNASINLWKAVGDEIPAASKKYTAARADLIQALTVPSPPSEDLPGIFEEYEKAALMGFCANPSFADTSEDKIAGYAEAQASAQMMRYEARKAREVKHG